MLARENPPLWFEMPGRKPLRMSGPVSLSLAVGGCATVNCPIPFPRDLRILQGPRSVAGRNALSAPRLVRSDGRPTPVGFPRLAPDGNLPIAGRHPLDLSTIWFNFYEPALIALADVSCRSAKTRGRCCFSTGLAGQLDCRSVETPTLSDRRGDVIVALRRPLASADQYVRFFTS